MPIFRNAFIKILIIDIVVSVLSWHTYSSLHKKIDRRNTGRDRALHKQKRHATIVRKQIYVCTDCGKGYTLRIKLLRHRKLECVKV